MVQNIEILTRRDYKMKMLISIKICDVFQIICFFVAKRYIMMSSLANCYAKYVFFQDICFDALLKLAYAKANVANRGIGQILSFRNTRI